MFVLRISSPQHVRRYDVHPAPDAGWTVRIEQDQRITRQDHYRDWHRVERVIEAFNREVAELREEGWSVIP